MTTAGGGGGGGGGGGAGAGAGAGVCAVQRRRLVTGSNSKHLLTN